MITLTNFGLINMTGTPKVWSKFSVKRKDGSVLNLRVVDMPRSLNDQFINLHIKYFANDEKTYIAAGVPNSPEAIEELRGRLLRVLDRDTFHVVICCVDDGADQIKEIIGASMMSLISKDDTPPQSDIKSDALKKLSQIVRGLEEYYDEMKEFDLDPCFSDRGLFVCTEYRGLGIAQELLRVRRLICKERGIPINGSWMSSYGTQKAAERDGWETVCEVSCDQLAKQFGVTFGQDPPFYKFQLVRIN